MYKRIISLILAILLIHTLVPIQGYAISESDYTDWFNEYSPSEAQMVGNSLGVRSNVDGKYINKYFLNLGDKSKLVYGTPFDWKNGHGYRYLGYNQNGDPFTNQEYIPDSMSGDFDPKEKDWIEKPWKYPHSDLITAQGLPKPQDNRLSYTPEWLKDAYTTVVGYYELTDFGIPTDQLYLYASIIQEPQTYSEGAVILYHYAAGRYWYLTLTIPPKHIPKLQDPTIDIKVKSSTNSESTSITVEDGESYEVLDRCESAYQDLGSRIIRYEVKKEKKEGNSWTTILSETLMHTGIEDDRSSYFKPYTDTPGEYRYTITEIEDLLGPISTNSKTAYVTVGEGGSEEPPEDPLDPELPPKPIENIPEVNIFIVTRDSNSNTPKNEIYEGESIYIKANTTGGIKYRYKIISDNSYYSSNEIVDGLFKINEPDYEAYASQKAYYTCYIYDPVTNTYIEDESYIEDTVDFIVKQIQPPRIDIDTNLSFDNLNILHIGDKIRLLSNAYDINEPSEEHPSGFDVINNWEIIEDSTNEIVLSGNGLFNHESYEVKKGIFKPDEYYTIRLISKNAFKPIRQTIKEIKFFVENQYPSVNLEIVSEDGIDPTFAKEIFYLKIKATDYDGYISNVDVDVLDDYDILVELSKDELSHIGNELYEANISYLSNDELYPTFSVSAYDDLGAKTTTIIKHPITKPNVVAVINIDDELNIQKKVNRYIKFDALDSNTNSPFPIDHSITQWRYRINNGTWIDISNAQSINNTDIRVYYPNFPNKDVIEMYPKRDGIFDFDLQVTDTKGFKSEVVSKSLNVDKDLIPQINYSVENLQHRITENDVLNNSNKSIAIKSDNIGKGYIKITDISKSVDGDTLIYKKFYLIYDGEGNGTGDNIEYTTIIYEDKLNGIDPTQEIVVNAEEYNLISVKDINNVNITFLTNTNALGSYYIKEEIAEQNTQLPPMSSTLYAELTDSALKNTSEYVNVLIDNLKPSITFEIGQDKAINIIVQYDAYMTYDIKNKISQLINNIESKGFEVNLIIYENQY